jgi:hypothetical protein
MIVAEDRMIAVLDHDHVLATQASVSLADLSDDPFILSDGGCEPLLRQMYKAAGLDLRPKLRVRDMATLLALVREQVGVTVIPELSFTDPRGLVAVPVEPLTHRRLVLTTHSQDVGPAAHAFLDLPTSGDWSNRLRRHPIQDVRSQHTAVGPVHPCPCVHHLSGNPRATPGSACGERPRGNFAAAQMQGRNQAVIDELLLRAPRRTPAAVDSPNRTGMVRAAG